MGEFYRAADTPKLPRSLAAPVPQQQKQKLEQAEWSRKGASLKKLSVLLERDVKAFYTTRSDLHQVRLSVELPRTQTVMCACQAAPRASKWVQGGIR